jgi:hypothetical protein
MPRSSRRNRREGDGVAELFEALDVAALEPLIIQPTEVVGTQVRIRFLVAQHMVEDHQHGMRHCQGGALAAHRGGHRLGGCGRLHLGRE